MNAVTVMALSLTLYTSVSLFADETNGYFLNDDLELGSQPGGKLVVSDAIIQAARNSPECQPSETDPHGHWGVPSEGFQLSIRMVTNTFRIGEKVPATVILRNVSETNLWFLPETTLRSSFEVFVSDSSGTIPSGTVTEKLTTFSNRLATLAHNPKPRTLLKGMQHKWSLDLENRPELQFPGQKKIRARQLVPSTDGTTNAAAWTAPVLVEILPAN